MEDPKRGCLTLLLIAAIAAILLMLTVACGRRNASTGQGAVTQRQQAATSNLPLQLQQNNVSGELARLHRPRTWQSTKGFTAGEDYFTDQIAVKFSDELPQGLPSAGAGGQPSYNPSSVIYQNPEHADYARALANSYGLSVLSGQEAYVPGMNFCAYQIPSGEDAEALMQRILDDNQQTVQYVEFVATRKAAYVPNDTYIGDQWHHGAIDSYNAWSNGTGSSNIWIAIIDTGVDLDHPDLVDNILPVNDWWTAEDFDLGMPDSIPEDYDGHGTHVAGCAAAVGNNSTGVAGVAYDCSILPIKLADDDGKLVGNSATAIILATELSYGIKTGADVINMSFCGYFPSRIEREACQYAYNNNVIVVAAAGNENCTAQIAYPAGAPTVMAVGATNESDDRASFSNYGWWVDIAAPGTSIYSTTFDGSYDYMQGTSMASPIVAGAAALIKSIYPTYAVDEYRGWLEAGGDPVANPEEWQSDLIRRLNVYGAVIYPENALPTVEFETPTDGSLVTGTTDIKLIADDDGNELYVNLYLDGILVSGDSLEYQIDFTNHAPGECSIIAEVIDQDHQHAFAEITVYNSNPTAFAIPYHTWFGDISGWTQCNSSGSNAWQLVSDGYSGTMLELSFAPDDVCWLESPNLSPNGASACRLVFISTCTDSERAWIKWSQGDLFGEDGGYVSFADLHPLSELFSGFSDYWYVDIEPQGNAPIKVMFGLDPGDTSGYIRLRDFWLTKPTNLPSVIITAPAENEQVSGDVTFTATSTDDWFVLQTDFYADGTELYSDVFAPYSVPFASVAFTNGPLLLEAVAFDWDWYDMDGDGSPGDYTVDSRNVIVANETITSLYPSSGFYGDQIRINGNWFCNNRAGAICSVEFTGESGPVQASTISWEFTQIQVIVPEGCISGPVKVWIDGGYAQSPENFTLSNPYTSLHFDAPDANLMFADDVPFEVHAQPDLDSVDVTIKGHPEKSLHFETLGSSTQITGTIDVDGLTTGTYYLQATGHSGTSSYAVERRIYLNTLPGDFNSDGIVDDGDAVFLRNYVETYGEVRSNNAYFVPFLDVNEDGVINEQDLPYIGYWYGTTLG